ncbi:hypothetical protein MC885_018897, partial [Smutsia gigantea]
MPREVMKLPLLSRVLPPRACHGTPGLQQPGVPSGGRPWGQARVQSCGVGQQEHMTTVWGLRRAMGPRCPPFPGRLGPPGPVCSWLQLVPPVFLSHLSRIPDNGGSSMSPGAEGEEQEEEQKRHSESCSYSSWSDSQPPEPFLPTLSPSSPNPTDSEPCPPPPVASFVPPRTSTVTGTQCDSMALRLGALPWSLSPYAHWLASPTRVIPDIGRTSSPIPAPSRCQADAKAWSLLTCLQCESQQEQLPQHPTEVSFRGDPTDKPGEACTPSLVNPDTQKLREILITRRTEQKMWKEKEKGEGSDHRLNCLRNKKSLGEEQGANVKSLGESTKGKPEQPASREKPPDTKALGDHLHQKCEQLFWGIPFLHSEALETNARESGSHQEICSISFNEHSHASPFQFQDRVRFAVNQALDLSAESNTHWEARNPAPSKGQGPNTSTSHGFAIFRPPAQQILEARVTGLQARRRWHPPLKIPKVINSFKLKKSHPWPLLCSRCTCSATCVPGAQLKAKFSQFSEKPQSPLGDKATKKVSIPSPVSHLPVPSPTYEEFQKAWGETPPVNGHVSSEAPLTTQVSRPPAQTMFMSVGRMWHSEMAVRAHKARLELSQGAATARNEPREESRGQAAQDSHCRVTTVLEVSTGSRSSSANEDRGSMAAEEASAWKATLESTVPANSRITNVDLRSGTPGTSKIPTLCVIQDLAEPCLDAQHSDAELHEQVESGKQPPDSGPDELVPYCHAHTLLPHCHSPAFLAADSSDSETSVCSSQSTSSGDTSAMDMSGDITLSRWASHRSSQGLKSCQLGQEEKQAPPESHFTKRQHFLQGISSSKVPQQKGRPPSATAESQGQDNSRSVPDSGAAEAQGIETAVGWTLEEKIRLQHGRPPSESNWHKGKFQAPVERGTTDFSYHRLLSYEEQGRVTREDACNHQATLKGHSSPGKSRWTRDKDDNRAFP